MVREVSLSDTYLFNILGLQVNDNFVRLFDLKVLLSKETDKIFGFYIDDTLWGFIHIQVIYEAIDIINIVVDKDKRNQGIGNELLNYVLNVYKGNNYYIILEVDEKNSLAIKLYEKNGFSVIDKRLNYYKNGNNALIMKRDV